MARLTRFEHESIANIACNIHGMGSQHWYPLNSVQPALHVVKWLKQSNGIGGLNETRFVYWNAQASSLRGFLGFRQRSVSDLTTGRYSYTDLYYHSSVQLLLPWKTNTNKDSEPLYRKELTLAPVGDPVSGFWVKTVAELTEDPQAETSSTLTNHAWNADGMVKHSTLEVAGIAETETWTSYVAAGPSDAEVLVESADVHQTRAGQSMVSSSAFNAYDALGRLVDSWKNQGTNAEVISHYELDPLCGMVSETVSTFNGAGSDEERRIRYTYDDKKRFVDTRSVWWVDPQTSVPEWINCSSTFHPAWGKPLTTLGADGLTVLNEYDVFGRTTRTSLPHEAGQLRGWVEYGRNWSVDMGANQFYVETITHPCNPEVETYFDQAGRPIRVATETFSHEWSVATSEYDAAGYLVTSTAPHLDSEPAITTSYSYDDPLERLTGTENTVTGSTTTAYTYENGELTVESANAAGQWSRKTTDATGKILRAEDDGGELRYSYDSWGNVTDIRHGNLEVMAASYDDVGRQMTLTDPGAGTSHYAYNPFGDLIRQEDANGHLVDLTYDNLGRLVRRENASEGITSYAYYHANGRFTNAPALIEGLGTTVRYDYDDPYNRLTKVKHTINGEDFQTEYIYDECDRTTGMTYPSGLLVWRDYVPDDGFLLDVWTGTTTLFTAGQLNGQGQYLDYSYGDGSTTTITREHGYPVHYHAQNGATEVFDHHLAFDNETGTLAYRWDGLADRKEVFSYDALNRLTQTRLYELDPMTHQEIGGLTTIPVQYDGTIGEHTRGNIIRKEDIGLFTNNGHQVRSAAGLTWPAPPNAPPSVINLEQQHIDYTPYSQPDRITEKIAGADYVLQYSYGPDHQRNRSVLTKDGVLQETRVYNGSYERQTLPITSETNHIHYVAGGDGLCAIIVTTNGETTVHHVYKDHLGSILKLTTMNGQQLEVTATQSFDPWGRPRNPVSWAQGSMPELPVWLFRGFTGHEHVEPFGLINMNGRMYDPLIGRMLSADNHIGSGAGSQAFNRYAYVSNSPTCGVDPSGEIGFLATALLGAIGGGYLAGSLSSGSFDPGQWEKNDWNAAGAGALAGAWAGTQLSGSLGLRGAIAKGGGFTKSFGIASTMLNASAIEMFEVMRHGGTNQEILRSGLVAAASSGFTVTGGLGLAKGGFFGRLGYQMVGTSMKSIGSNWATGNDPLSKVTLGVGPVNLTLGKGQTLFQLENNKGNVAINGLGLGNLLTGGKASWDWEHLTMVYSKGALDKMLSASVGAHALFVKNSSQSTKNHELHHLWQSRSMGDAFIPTYLLNGLTVGLYRGDFDGRVIFGDDNYFEFAPVSEPWW